MKSVNLRKTSSPNQGINAKYCDSFFSKFLGLMFTKVLEPDCGLLLVEKRESRLNTAIHMFFMNYDIAVLWLDEDLVIVDKILARKWVAFYCPKKPAQFVFELHASKFTEYAIGDKLEMIKLE